MRILDLFSGTGGASQAFLDRGHDVVRIDNDPQFADVPNTIIDDVRNDMYSGEFDVVWASPPCQAFSLGAGGTHIAAFRDCVCGGLYTKVHEEWTHTVHEPGLSCGPTGMTRLAPVSDFGKMSIQLVERTLELIDIIKPRYWWMENPNGGMIHFVPDDIPRVQVTYCSYKESRMKLTNLWGNWPDTWHPRPKCRNGAPCPMCGGVGAIDHVEDGTFGVTCERCGGSGKCHEPAPRGAKTGTQGIKGAVARAIVPYELSMEVCKSVEEAAG